MTTCKHEKLTEGYYGHDCAACGELIYPWGQAPWDYLTDEEQAQIEREEYEATHGRCETCGGEWGDGWSTCTCDQPRRYRVCKRWHITRFLKVCHTNWSRYYMPGMQPQQRCSPAARK